jgi:acetoin utilization protein AcuA
VAAQFKGDDHIDTPKGRVWIKTRSQPDFIASLELEEGMGAFAAPNYPAVREKKALERIGRNEESNIISAFTEEGELVGFIAIAPPSKAERWGKQGGKGLIEAMAIEVSRNWRSMGIANKMMEAGVGDPFFDDKILICTAYAWHWDLESTGLDKETYRRMLLRYLEKAGFMYYETDEPNVNLDSANFLTAHIGPEVSSELYNRFEQMLFKDEEWADFKGRPRSIGDVLGEGRITLGNDQG